MQDFHFWFAQLAAQVEYRGQTGHTRILNCEPLINTYYQIGQIGVEFFLREFVTNFRLCTCTSFITVRFLLRFKPVLLNLD